MCIIYKNIQSVPCSKHCVGCETSQLMLYRETVTVCSKNHPKHIHKELWTGSRTL